MVHHRPLLVLALDILLLAVIFELGLCTAPPAAALLPVSSPSASLPGRGRHPPLWEAAWCLAPGDERVVVGPITHPPRHPVPVGDKFNAGGSCLALWRRQMRLLRGLLITHPCSRGLRPQARRRISDAGCPKDAVQVEPSRQPVPEEVWRLALRLLRSPPGQSQPDGA